MPPWPERSVPGWPWRPTASRRWRKPVRSLPRNDPAYLAVSTPQGASGGLQHEGDAFLFTCVPDSPREAEVSLTMPRRAAPYVGTALLPVFQMNLPEGYVLEQLRQRFAKASRLSPMLLLALTG